MRQASLLAIVCLSGAIVMRLLRGLLITIFVLASAGVVQAQAPYHRLRPRALHRHGVQSSLRRHRTR